MKFITWPLPAWPLARSIAVTVADGVNASRFAAAQAVPWAAGTETYPIAARLGGVKPVTGEPFSAKGTLQSPAPIRFDGIARPVGASGEKTPSCRDPVMDFIEALGHPFLPEREPGALAA